MPQFSLAPSLHVLPAWSCISRSRFAEDLPRAPFPDAFTAAQSQLAMFRFILSVVALHGVG